MLDFGPLDLTVPVIMLIMTIIYLPITFIVLLKDLKFSQLTSWDAFQQAWFERFWAFFGSASKPLFASDVEAILAKARGVVLDVGPGSGDWMYLFSPARNKHISKLLLLEPNSNFHQSLRARAEKLGLDGRYEIIDGGVEDLERMGIQTGTIDTITTVHVLCSVNAPQALIKELYRYLKPGGQWLVYEHIKIRNEKTLAAFWQGE
jgi:SAM-dependent methyltransferase